MLYSSFDLLCKYSQLIVFFFFFSRQRTDYEFGFILLGWRRFIKARCFPWLYEYDATDKNFVQGEGPNIAGTGNTGYGVGSLPVLDTGQNNTAFGADAGLRLESSSNNTLIGWEAGRNIWLVVIYI